jgi:hypothetical protein
MADTENAETHAAPTEPISRHVIYCGGKVPTPPSKMAQLI